MIPVSVVITSYNHRRFLAEAVKSVLTQSYEPSEIIICDDNSDDGSKKLIRKYANDIDKVKPIFQEANVGVAKNRNDGLYVCKYPYISILDGDDWYSHRKLEYEFNALEGQEKYGWAYSREKIVNKIGKYQKIRLDRKTGKTGDIFEEILYQDISPKHWLMRKSALEDVGYLDEDMDSYEDWEFKIRLSHDYKAIFCPEPFICYRQRSGGLHNLPDVKRIKEQWKLYDKVLWEKRDKLNRIENILYGKDYYG